MNAPTNLAVLKGEERQKALAAMPPKARVSALLTERKDDIAKMLPAHLSADRLLKVATIAATTTPALLECEIPSLITAVGQCAMFGLEPNTILGHAYMIPFNKSEKHGNEWKKRKLVQVVIGYKGLIDLARRSGQIVSIAAQEVRENDEFDYAYGLEERLMHRPAEGDRGRITHFYAYAKLKDGGTAFEVMSKQQVDEIRDAAAVKNGAKRDGDGKVEIKGPWKDHYTEMGRKTVIRRLAKYLPLSVEFQRAVALDEAGDNGAAIGAINGEFTVEHDDGGDSAPAQAERAFYPPEQFEKELPGWKKLIASGRKTPDAIIATAEAKHPLTAEQKAQIAAAAGGDASQQQSGAPAVTYAQLADRFQKCTDLDILDADATLIGEIDDPQQRSELSEIYHARRAELAGE